MKNISDALNPSIYQAARQSEQLKRLVSQCMPAELAAQILFARIAQHTLRLTVSNSAWAARLRFHSKTIKERLIQASNAVDDISVHVLPASKKIDIGPRESNRLIPQASAKSVSTIRQVADSLGDKDEQNSLQQALGRLAGNLDSRS